MSCHRWQASYHSLKILCVAGKIVSQIQSGLSSIEGTFSDKKGELESATKKATSNMQDKVDDATGSSGVLFRALNTSLKGTIEDIKDSVQQKDADAKKALNNASTTVQDKFQ